MTMNPAVRPLMAAVLALSSCLAAWQVQASETYPSRVVSLLVPYPAGGLSDSIARTLNMALGRELGEQVIVENLGGVSGALAAQRVLNAPSDGHLIFLGSPNEVILAPLANAAVKLKAEDFRLLGRVTVNPLMIVARNDLPVQSADELIALAQQSQGRQSLTYGSVGVGSMYHLLTESLSQKAGLETVHVPYKGMAPLLQDMGGNAVDFAILPYATSFRGLSDSGRLKLLGWLDDERRPLDTSVPAVGEGTALKGFNHETWAGLMVKRDTPEPIVARLHEALNKVLQDPTVRRQLEATGSEVASPVSQAEADASLLEEAQKFRAMAKAIGLQPQ